MLIDYLASIKHLGVKSQVGYQQRLSVFADWCTLARVMLQQVNNRNVQAFLEWLRTNLNLDRYIPYRTLHLPYPGQLYPSDEHKDDRDYCTIQFAGKAAETLLYEQLGLPESPTLSDENTQDIRQARERARLRFKPEEQEKELLNAENRAKSLLSEPTCWRMVGNLAYELINSILFSKEPDRQYERNNIPVKEYEFGSNQIYMNLALTLTGNNQ